MFCRNFLKRLHFYLMSFLIFDCIFAEIFLSPVPKFGFSTNLPTFLFFIFLFKDFFSRKQH